MSLSKRLSISSTRSGRRSASPMAFAAAPNADSEDWVRIWAGVLAKDLIESPVVEVDAETAVEDACDLLLSKDASCLAVKAAGDASYTGLFDYADVNAFLTFAATRHTYSAEHLQEHPRVAQILEAAKAGHVPVRLVSNLSDKNALVELPHDASVIALLGVFSLGTHRALIQAPPSTSPSSPRHLGLISDLRLLAYFHAYARSPSPSPSSPSPYDIPSPLSTHISASPSSPFGSSSSSVAFLRYLSTPLSSLPLPSLALFRAVAAVRARAPVLDAMRMMSEQGVSSVAVLADEAGGDGGGLLSAVSVTDIGKTVVPAQSNQILTMPLQQFVTQIKMPHGSTDGADRHPVYSVFPSSTLVYTIQKLLATNSHRVFVTSDTAGGTLSGIVSVGDILSLFALLAHLDVDPTRAQRHRRASSVSSQGSSASSSSGSLADLARSTSRGSAGAGRRG
ncbi:hypothetical protein FA95DRAFT_674696 [Auriscalpium vulgare]|uniref:Uncharacterized protein n=1 Tax=Auriscalpium vulgare TaxID=40419 RepID=A0ACB8RDE6_9AGAM|nr:hypothetical protein FA95DRAFT_674696 [Auriscalpium vulgare]